MGPASRSSSRGGDDPDPEQLSAEILKALRQTSPINSERRIERAVISVPALFELPAERCDLGGGALAGFARVELLQERSRSALAAAGGRG